MQRIGKVVSVGECMIELARGSDRRYGLAFGGDTFNTAVYLARAGIPVSYATLLGDDPYSMGIRASAALEAIGTELIGTRPGRIPGLYLIETGPDGERSFAYWRDQAPARELFDTPMGDTVAAAMKDAAAVYYSGITLSLYSDAGLDRFAEALTAARAAGARIVMDSNFRPRGWSHDLDRARTVFDRFWRLTDWALPTFDDEQALWGDQDMDATLARFARLAIPEIVVKNGAAGATVLTRDWAKDIACPSARPPIDTTAAGDSFNAAYIAARLRGAPPDDACRLGHRLAGAVIQHRGAIAPWQATAPILEPRRR